MMFDSTGTGEITRVYYDNDEDPVALTLKKIILGTLSAKLIVSQSQLRTNSRWAYRVNETGHEGQSPYNNARDRNYTDTLVLDNCLSPGVFMVSVH